MTLYVFQSDISGNDIKDLHPKNIFSILVTLDISHFDISGNEIKDSHSKNIPPIFLIFDVSQFDISGKDKICIQKIYNSYL